MFATAEKSTPSPGIIHRHGNDNPVFFRKPGEEEAVGEQQSTFFSPAVQAKLSVSRPDDPQEKEADAVASQVMRMPEPVAEPEKKREEEVVSTKLSPGFISRAAMFESDVAESPEETGAGKEIQRKYSQDHHTRVIQRTGRGPPGNMMNFEQNLSSSRGNGSPLPGTTREFMQKRFNADFSGVRIHTGSYAESMSNTIHAQAFTHGQDIYFNSGKYSPHTEAGGTLLAHELTHTIQQGQGNVRLQRKLPDESIISNIDLSGRAGGQQLPEEAKDYLEDYYKKDLSDIRIFSDNEIAGICRAAGIKAFTKDKNIAIPPSRLDPNSEDGAVLLSEQVSNSLKQRGINSTASDGNDIGGANTLMGQIMAAIKTVKEEAEKKPKEKSAEPPVAIPEGESKAKKATGEKTPVIEKGKTKGPGKGKGKAKDTGGRSFKAVKRDPQKSPSTPEEDPAFIAVVTNSKKRAKDQKQHEDEGKKSAEAQNSAEAVPNEAESKAQNRKTEGMGEAAKVDKPFDAASFKADLLKKIEDVTPKSLEEANEFKENNKIGGIKNAMGEKLASEKENTTGPVSVSSKQPLQVNPGDNKQPVPLPPTPQGPMPPGINAKNAAPKNKTEGEISMQEQSLSLDDEMKQNNVTESQLTTSNEPTFTQALDEKRNAQKDAAEKPKEYRKDEALALKEAKAEANSTSVKSLAGMHNARGKNFEVAVTHQQTAKQKDEEARAKVAIDIENIYKATETKVNKALTEADSESNRIFDEGAETARVQFENYVERKMNEYKIRRYSGFWGGLRWAKDKLFGMPDAVNQFYTDGRAQYLKQMDDVITLVADTVTLKLNEAKQAITDGKKEIDKYVAKLPQDLQEVGKEAADNIKDKFDTLEQSVNDKRDQLIEGLAKKYVDNVKKLDERINELKEANKGLIDKAIGFLKKVWKVIKDLVNLFTTILARLASIIGVILDSPSGFFANLGKAFKMGFDNFKNKFTEYLELGLMEWLATNLGIKGIELPKRFDASAIFSLALQVMGITKEHIKERAIALLGERKVALLEKAGGLIYRVYNDGLGVIWDMIVEKLSDFKELVWDAIKSFIQKSIIEAALMFILSLLNPIGAFIKLCIAIYDFLMMLVKFKDKIIELLDTILSAVMQIATGAVEGAAAMIEKALAKSISIIIAFLAALLHLNNIFSKIREIITRIQKRVEKALDWVILKAYALLGKMVEGALKLEDKATEMVEKGKQAVVGAGKKVAGAVLGWLGLRKEFTMENGEKHTLSLGKSASKAQLMMESTPIPLLTFIEQFIAQPNLPANKQQAAKEAKTYALTVVTPAMDQINSAPEGIDTKPMETALLGKMVELTEKIRLLVGTDKLSNHVDKYLLEGAAGTFESMPKPKYDELTADHVPQNAIFQVIMDLGVFDSDSPMAKHAEKRTDKGYAMNEQKIRHMAGRTFGPKGSVTKANFKAKADQIVKTKPNKAEKKNALVEALKTEKNEDISVLKTVYSKGIDDPVWKDVKDLPVNEEDKITMQTRIKGQAEAGLSLIIAQPLDALKA
jgi:hypothetical protein